MTARVMSLFILYNIVMNIANTEDWINAFTFKSGV